MKRSFGTYEARWRGWFGIAVLACLIVGSAVVANASPGAGAIGARVAVSLPLKARLMINSDFPGYERSRVLVIHTPSGWTQAIPAISAQTLRQLGFVTAAIANMQTVSAQRRAQTSLTASIVQFRSNQGAAAYAATFLSLEPSRYKRFQVHAIPHSYGMALPQGGGGFYEVGFVDGPFVYDLYVSIIDPKYWPSEALTVKAATRWYDRVHGR
jgi:hypothetical protein